MLKRSREEEFTALEVKARLFRDWAHVFRDWAHGRRGDVEHAIDGLSRDIETLRAIDASEDI